MLILTNGWTHRFFFGATSGAGRFSGSGLVFAASLGGALWETGATWLTPQRIPTFFVVLLFCSSDRKTQ